MSERTLPGTSYLSAARIGDGVDSRQGRLEAGALILLAYFSVIFGGYHLNDMLVYLPMTLYLRNPSLYPGSSLVAHLLTMPYPVYHLYAWFYDQRVLFATFLIVRILLVASLFFLGTRLSRDRWATSLGLVLVLFSPPAFGTLGSTSLLLPDPSQQAWVVPVLLFALGLSLGGYPLFSFALAGLALNLHPMLGTAALALLGVQWLIAGLWLEKRITWRQALSYTLTAVLCALPALVNILSGLGRFTASTPNFLEIIRFSLSFHVFPSTFTPQEYLGTALTLVYLGLGLKSPAVRLHRRTILIWLTVIAVFCIGGTIFSEIVPVPFVLKLMPFRSTLFVRVLGLICAAIYLRPRMDSRHARDWALVALTLFGFLVDGRVLLFALGLDLILTYSRLWQLLGAALSITLALLAILQIGYPPGVPSFLQPLVLSPGTLISSLRPSALFAYVLGLIVLGAKYLSRASAPLLAGWAHRFRQPWVNPAGFGLLLVTTLLLFAAPAPLDRYIQIPLRAPLNDLEDAALWAKRQTPVNALFITPPDVGIEGFEVFAERDTLGNYKQAGQSILDPHFASIIYQRLKDLGCTNTWCWGNTFTSFDTATFRALAARYHACYVLTSASQTLAFQEVYHNASFNLYSICGPG